MIHDELVTACGQTPVRKEVSIYLIERVAKSLADTCKRDNRYFQLDTFFEACGLDDNGKFVDHSKAKK